MLIRYGKFEWHSEKAEYNYKRHGIKFERAIEVFKDRNRITKEDPYEYEERWQTTGLNKNGMLWFVVYTYISTEDGNFTRIISARRTSTAERKEYGNRKLF